MRVKRLLVVIAATATLFLPVQACMSEPMANQDMQCCKSMACMPQIGAQRCCKDMASPVAPNMLPARRGALQAPAVAVIDYPQAVDLTGLTTYVLFDAVRAQQHSPPELYKLHASLLI